MSQSKFPAGWDEKRVQRVLAYYVTQTEDEAVAEDEVAYEQEGQTNMENPQELVSNVRDMIAQHTHGLLQALKNENCNVQKSKRIIM